MAFEMVHRDGRLADGQGQRFGESAADEQRPGQAGAAGLGHGIDIAQ